MELKDVVIKAQKGDAKAFASLFEQTQKMVYFNALKITGNETVAEDVVQDVYMKALEKLGSLKVPEAFIGWLRQITVNTCKDYLAAHNTSVLGADEADEELAKLPALDEDFLPQEYADNKETCRLIMAMVDSLPDAQRVAVILYYYNELPVSRIAELLQVSENTVKSRLNYARRQIKEQVEDLEKKGTKLHAVPVLGLILRNAAEDYSLSNAASASIIASVTASVATTAASTTAAVGGGILAKIAALPVVTKVVAGVVAAAIAIGAGVGISNAVKDDEKKVTLSEFVTLDGGMAEAYRKIDLGDFINMPLEEAIACFGDGYEKESYESGEEYISYKFNYGKEYDYLIFQYADNDGTDVVYSIQILGSIVNCMGLNLSKTPDEAREILKENGFELAHSSEGEYNHELYTNEEAGYQVSFMYQGDDVVNVSLDSFYDYFNDGEEVDLAPRYDAFITSGDYIIATKGDEAVIADYIGYGVNVVIPSEIDGYRVTAIDSVWDFENNVQYTGLAYSDFESIIVPEGVAKIGSYAFKHCNNLKTVELPDSLTEIGSSAFAWCWDLESIVIPSGVKAIESSTFWDCESLRDIILPGTLESIGSGAFNGCAFESVSIPESVTFIDEGAFAECRDLVSITLPKGITEISNELFSECDSLENVEIPSGVKGIGDGAFYECYSLESVVLPKKLERIGDGAFGKCDSLKEIVLPKSVTHIGSSAFCYCESLEKVTIPASVESIGEFSPFAACNELSIEVELGGNFRLDDCGALYTDDMKELIYVRYNTEEFEIPKSVTKIRAGAFAECDSIETVIIPDGVEEIGENAFLWCDNLKSVEVPNSVKTIGAEAFTVGYGFEGIKCREGSYAESYAKENNVAYELVK